jgi:hypothetical protein
MNKITRWLHDSAYIPAIAVVLPLAAAPIHEPLPDGAMVWFDMVLEGGKPGGGDLRCLVQVVGNQPTVVGFGSPEVQYRQYDGVTLTYTGSGLSGKQRVFEGESYDYFMELDVAASGSSLGGTYAFLRSKAINDNGTMVSGWSDLRGKVTGSIRNSGQLQTVNAMPAHHAWDSYVGPDQNFATGKTGVTLMEKAEDAKLV